MLKEAISGNISLYPKTFTISHSASPSIIFRCTTLSVFSLSTKMSLLFLFYFLRLSFSAFYFLFDIYLQSHFSSLCFSLCSMNLFRGQLKSLGVGNLLLSQAESMDSADFTLLHYRQSSLFFSCL